jgi:hypothetical protein
MVWIHLLGGDSCCLVAGVLADGDHHIGESETTRKNTGCKGKALETFESIVGIKSHKDQVI